MKRSSKISLVLLASVTGVASLSGCEPSPPAKVDHGGTFASKAECVATYDQATCDAADKLAQQEHLQNAPKFNSLDDCRAQYGADMCRPASAYGGSGNSYVPLMAAFMMGSAMSNPAPVYYAPMSYQHAGQAGYRAPMYTSGTGLAHNVAVGSAPFQSVRPGISTRGSLNSTTALTPAASTRGGFGGSFQPTKSFATNYAASNPSSSVGRAPSVGGSSIGRSLGSSSARSSTSVSSRGGFGSMGRGFGGGFGG